MLSNKWPYLTPIPTLRVARRNFGRSKNPLTRPGLTLRRARKKISVLHRARARVIRIPRKRVRATKTCFACDPGMHAVTVGGTLFWTRRKNAFLGGGYFFIIKSFTPSHSPALPRFFLSAPFRTHTGSSATKPKRFSQF